MYWFCRISVQFLCLSLLCQHLAELIMTVVVGTGKPSGIDTQHIAGLPFCIQNSMGAARGDTAFCLPPSSSPYPQTCQDAVRLGVAGADRVCVLACSSGNYLSLFSKYFVLLFIPWKHLSNFSQRLVYSHEDSSLTVGFKIKTAEA